MDRRYWDSDCFLGWLMGEDDKEDACRDVLQAAEDGNVIIVTSALTIAEVLALRGHEKIPSNQREKIELFFRNEYIEVRNITRRISESARSYVWDHGVKPKDVIAHLSPPADQAGGISGSATRAVRRLASGLRPLIRPVATMEQMSA